MNKERQRNRSYNIAKYIIFSVSLTIVAACSSPNFTQPPQTLLTAGTLRGQEATASQVLLEQGETYRLSIYSTHGPLSVTIIDANNSVLSQQYDPLADHTAMRVSITAPATEAYSLQLTRMQRTGNDIQYEIYLQKLPSTGRQLEKLAKAALTEAKANEYYHAASQAPKGERKTLFREARHYYQNASVLWEQLGASEESAINHYRAAVLLRDLELREESIRELRLTVDRVREPNLKAWVHATLGALLEREGDSEQARFVLTNGLGVLDDAADVDLNARASLENYLGLSWHKQNHYDKAVDWYNAAIKSASQAGNERQLAMSSGNLGGIHYNRGEANLALKAFGGLLENSAKSGNLRGQLAALGNTGSVYLRSGEFSRALTVFDQVAELTNFEAEPQNYIRNVQRRAMCYTKVGDFQQAEVQLQEALDLLVRYPEKPRVASVTSSLAEVAFERGNYTEALRRSEAAIELHRDTQNEHGVYDSISTAARSALSMALQERAQEYLVLLDGLKLVNKSAEQSAERIELEARLQALSYLDSHKTSPENYHDESYLSPFRCSPSNFGKAVTLPVQNTERKLDITYKLFKQAYCDYEAAGHTLGSLSTLLAAAEFTVKRQDYELAARITRRGFELIESSLEQVFLPSQRAQFFAHHIRIYDIAISSLMQLHYLNPTSNYHFSALQLREQVQARVLKEQLSGSTRPIVANVSLDQPLIRRRERLLRDYYATLSNVYDAAEKKSDESKQMQQRLAQLRNELDAIDIRLSVNPAVSINQIDIVNYSSQVAADDLILVFWLSQDRSILWAIERDSVNAYLLANHEKIRLISSKLFLSVSKGQIGGTFSERAALGKLLLEPVADRLTDKSVSLVLDAELHSIPFSALIVPGSNKPLDAITPTHILPSLAFYRDSMQSSNVGYRSVAIVADPIYSANDERVTQLEKGKLGQQPVTRGSERELHRLKHTIGEAKFVASLFDKNNVVAFTGYDAIKASLFEAGVSNKDIFHMAVHGQAHPSFPELSSLRLSALDRQGNPLDDRLSLSDIALLPIAPRLVVLSACETGTGPLIRGEGYMSLSRAFLGRGAKHVVATLWPVPDDSTAQLMKTFYESLISDDTSPHVALQRARSAIRLTAGFEDPYFWAGFVLVGQNP